MLRNLNYALLLFLISGFADASALPFLHRNEVNLKDFPKPPVSGSKEDIADFYELYKIKMGRNKYSIARANREAFDISIKTLFGRQLSEDEMKLAGSTYSKLIKTTDYFVNKLKKAHNRPRPCYRTWWVNAVVPVHPSSSYPSGHAAISRVESLFLAKAFPEKSKVLIARGAQVGQNRLVAGVHHPSDVAAGVHLGDLVFEALSRDKNFNETVSRIQKRLKARRTLH